MNLDGLLLDNLIRLLPAVLFTFLSVFLVVHIRRGLLRPLAVWKYVALAAIASAAWRWVVLALSVTEFWPYLLATWVSPVTQAMYTFLAVAILLLAYVGKRKRADG